MRDLETRLSNLKQTFQPQIILVGNLASPDTVYVAINKDRLFKCESILEALDLAFKFFFALDLAYPAGSLEVWTFIQRVAYDICLSGDTGTTTQITSLAGEVANEMQRDNQTKIV